MRVSDAERRRVEGWLQHHYSVGRLTLPELESRVALAYEARTQEQLEAVLADLPGWRERGRAANGEDRRLLIILSCTFPPAALVYWLATRRRGPGRGARPQVERPRPRPELESDEE
ncbi:protein of unknown function [Actinacidiphila yanglinensis]|uniref:DUF1707 domain-containing protein n=2 Tax=Actinacidiphila yanglinensis TaxID=310779 RepID=A0A1H5YWG1_9ACTN|nr:protein of unknown function [Actinacidiphila yanglinensis]